MGQTWASGNQHGVGKRGTGLHQKLLRCAELERFYKEPFLCTHTYACTYLTLGQMDHVKKLTAAQSIVYSYMTTQLAHSISKCSVKQKK